MKELNAFKKIRNDIGEIKVQQNTLNAIYGMKSGIFFLHGYKGFYVVNCSPHYQNEIPKHRFGYIFIFR